MNEKSYSLTKCFIDKYSIIGIILAGLMLISILIFYPLRVESAEKPPGEKRVDEKFPGIATGILKSARLVKMKGDLLLNTADIEIREPEIRILLKHAPPKLRSELEKSLFFLLEQQVTSKILLHQAESAGFSANGRAGDQAVQDFLSRMVENTVVSEKETRSFYDENKAMVGGMPFEQVKESIGGFLLQQKKQSAIISHIENLGHQLDMRVNAEWTGKQYVLAMDNPVDRARGSGKPTMVEFGAAGCIPCDMMQPILDKLRKKYHDKLNIVFVHVKEQQVLGTRYGIRSIPVQVFFDKTGKEMFRHEGFYPEVKVLEQLLKLGVK